MNHILRKPAIIDGVGRVRFWTGILLGIWMSMVLPLFLVYGRRLWYAFFSVFNKMPSSVSSTNDYYEQWLIYVGLCLSVSFTIKYWLEGGLLSWKTRRRRATLCMAINSIQFWIVLLLIIRFGLLLFLAYMETPKEITNPLNVWNEFMWMLNLIPVVVFLNSWLVLRQMFYCGRLMTLVAVTTILLGYVLKLFI